MSNLYFKYIYVHGNQGYYKTFQPFLCNKEFTQAKHDEALKVTGRGGRFASSLKDFEDILGIEGFEFLFYYSTYREVGSLVQKGKLDPLPSDFCDWKLIEGTFGNY